MAFTADVVERLERRSLPVSRLAGHGIPLATFDRRVGNRSPVRTRRLDQVVQAPVDFQFDRVPLLDGQQIPPAIEFLQVLKLVNLVDASAILYFA